MQPVAYDRLKTIVIAGTLVTRTNSITRTFCRTGRWAVFMADLKPRMVCTRGKPVYGGVCQDSWGITFITAVGPLLENIGFLVQRIASGEISLHYTCSTANKQQR